MSSKKRWRGTFNWYGEVFVLYRSGCDGLVKEYMIQDLAVRVGIHASVVRSYFSGHRDNYRIEETGTGDLKLVHPR